MVNAKDLESFTIGSTPFFNCKSEDFNPKCLLAKQKFIKLLSLKKYKLNKLKAFKAFNID